MRSIRPKRASIPRSSSLSRPAARCWSGDGKPIYTDHKERLAALQAQLVEQFTQVEAQIGQAPALAAQEAASRAAGSDLVDTLTPDELARANNRRAFVEEDADGLAPSALVGALAGRSPLAPIGRAAAAGERAAAKRVSAQQEQSKRPGAPRSFNAWDGAAFAEVTQLVRGLETRLTLPAWATPSARLHRPGSRVSRRSRSSSSRLRQRLQPGRRTSVRF